MAKLARQGRCVRNQTRKFLIVSEIKLENVKRRATCAKLANLAKLANFAKLAKLGRFGPTGPS